MLTAGSAYQPLGHRRRTTRTNGRYDLTYTYQNNGTNVNLTGSPDYAAKIVYVGDPGSGCSSNQYAQFNTAAVTGPQYGSVGLESGRFILGGCPDHTVDLAIARHIRLGGNRTLQFRLDVFNVFNTVDHQRSQEERHLPEPDGSDDRQFAVPPGWLARSGAAHAEERGVRRRHRRAAAAEHAAADSVGILGDEWCRVGQRRGLWSGEVLRCGGSELF